MENYEHGGAPGRKRRRTVKTHAQQLQRGVDAGRIVVEQLRQVVPLAVEALTRQLDTSVAHLRQVEEALQEELRREAADGEGAVHQDLAEEQLQLVTQLEDDLHLLTSAECSVLVTEEADGAKWRSAPAALGGVGDMLRPLVLRFQADGQLEKVEDAPAPAGPAAYVGPPSIYSVSIYDTDIDFDGLLKVDDILRNKRRWKKTVRSLRNLKGRDSERLLRLVAPQLEELQISDNAVGPPVMEEVANMPLLKRLSVQLDVESNDFPDLPLQLEELNIRYPAENQLRCLQRMPRLRSLRVYGYRGPNVAFPPAPHGAGAGALLWLGVGFNSVRRATMWSLVRAYAPRLQELEIYWLVHKEGDDLGEQLAASGLQALRRLVLDRAGNEPCAEVAACLLQRRTLRGFLAPHVEVTCNACDTSVF